MFTRSVIAHLAFSISLGSVGVVFAKDNPRKDVSLIFLYETCGAVGLTANGKIPFFDCESYVYGVLDTYISFRSELPISKRACFPIDLTPREALQLTEPFVNGSMSNLAAGAVILAALGKRYPCK